MGRTVALFGGSMFGQYRTVTANTCLPLPAGTTAAEGASCFVNPLTSPVYGRDDAAGGA